MDSLDGCMKGWMDRQWMNGQFGWMDGLMNE